MSDFCSQINFGVNNVKTKWFSFIEFDDEYSNNWLKNVDEYVNSYEDVNVFLPIIVNVDEKGEFIGLSNEPVWANGFSDKLGYLDNDILLAYQNFNFSGFAMTKETFIDNGGLKKSLKLTFIYEFLLRLTYKDIKIMVLPKIGYKHMNHRVGSLFNTYLSEMNSVESNWWLAQAKKEYFFNNERQITYEIK